MTKKYGVLTLKIDKDKNLILETEIDEKILKKRKVVYIYYGKSSLYIGKSNKLEQRHKQHKREENFDYSNLIILHGNLVSKNLDYIEKVLINLFITDNDKTAKEGKKRKVRNKKSGDDCEYTNLEKEIDANVITPFWENELNELKLVKLKTIAKVKNNILFKYSPFFTLNKQQKEIIDRILSKDGNYLIEGGAGTGKTVLLTNLAAKIYEKYDGKKKIAVVVKSNWKKNGEKIFKNYGIEEVTVDTWNKIILNQKKYDYILVDEAHRLPYKYGGGQMAPDFKGLSNEKYSLKSLEKLGKSLILFYDEKQAIRPSDTPVDYFQEYFKNKKFQKFSLGTQFRISVNDKNKKYTADDYLKGIKYVLQLSEDNSFDKEVFNNSNKDSYFGLVDSIADLFKYIERMDNLIQDSQNRVIAGYTRKWKSKNDSTQLDWIEGERGWKWNSTHVNWINRENSRKEIGCVHSIQGIDINCVGLIIAKDLIYREGKVIANLKEYCDKYGRTDNIDELTGLIKNIYYVLATRGIDGIRIYIEDKELRNYFMRTLGIKKMK
jgi:hypothetical protein